MKKVDLMLGINLRGTYLAWVKTWFNCTNTLGVLKLQSLPFLAAKNRFILPLFYLFLYFRTKLCIPHLLRSKNPHILNLSPPLNLNPVWFKNHTGKKRWLWFFLHHSCISLTHTLFAAYTMAKYGMSMCVLGMAEEFRGSIAVNALWPRTGYRLLILTVDCMFVFSSI